MTIAALVFGVGLVAAMAWRERRPRDGFNVSLVPTTPVMFVGALITILAIVYLLHINGIQLPSRGFGG